MDFTAYLHVASWLISAGAVVLPLTNLYFLGRALSHFSASKVVPIYFSTIVLMSTCSGGIYFGELSCLAAAAAAGLGVGILLVIGGVYLITAGARRPRPRTPLAPSRRPPAPASPAARVRRS